MRIYELLFRVAPQRVQAYCV